MNPTRLKILSFNIQLGLQTGHFAHYLTGAWRHVLPALGAPKGLELVARIVKDFDFVSLQEADAGSVRTRFLNHIEFLAERAEFPYHGLTVTRDLRPVARHCLGFLSRWPARIVGDHALPSLLPGRRALQVELLRPDGAWRIFVVHLSLDRMTQKRQLGFISDLVCAQTPSILVGDFNCESSALKGHPALRRVGFRVADAAPPTFPSWAPSKDLDHILVAGPLRLESMWTLPQARSDHLPLAAVVSKETFP